MRRSPKNVYLHFIEFERKAADIYLRLAAHFAAHNRKLAGFWLDMAVEEKEHARLLEFCAAENWFAKKLPDESELSKFSEFFRKMEKRAADPELDKNAAFEIAAELEGSEINAVYDYLTIPAHISTYVLKKKIMTGPWDHVRHLAAAGKKFGAPSATLTRLERLKDACGQLWSQAS